MVKALQFHKITPEVQFAGTWNSPGQFERLLRFLIDAGFRIGLPQQDVDLVLCFDDGDRSVYNYAFPVLKDYNIKALVFLVAGYIGRKNYWDIGSFGRYTKHLSWDEILKMHSWGICFGSHTMNHRNLTRLDKYQLEYELVESRMVLEKRLGPVDTISYPFNRVNHKVLDAVKKAGYRYGFGGDGSTRLLIKKEAIYIIDNPYSLSVKVQERPLIFYRYERMKQRIINYFTIATMIKRK